MAKVEDKIVVKATFKVATGHRNHGTGRPGYQSDKRLRRSTRKSCTEKAVREYE